jgi:hypothetical protein
MGRMGVAVQSSYISGDFARIGCFSPLLAWLPSLKIHHTIYVCSAVEDGIEHRIITIYTTIKNKSWSTISKEWILLFWVGLSWLFTIQTITIIVNRYINPQFQSSKCYNRIFGWLQSNILFILLLSPCRMLPFKTCLLFEWCVDYDRIAATRNSPV